VYVNVILPPGCPQDDCVLRASCSAAHTTEQVGRALDIFARVARELGVARVALS
jgi:7-keto-8-aminopelargonate synthetase-like enzyme